MSQSKPLPIKWADHFPPLPKLNRPLRVAMPCVGIDGCGEAFDTMGVDFIPCNVYDLDKRYEQHLIGHFKNPADGLFLGKTQGDLTTVNLQQLRLPIDMLCSGPPCPPWAGNGNKCGREDARSHVFVAVVTWVIHAIKKGGLIAALMENVPGVLQEVGVNLPSCTYFLGF